MGLHRSQMLTRHPDIDGAALATIEPEKQGNVLGQATDLEKAVEVLGLADVANCLERRHLDGVALEPARARDAARETRRARVALDA